MCLWMCINLQNMSETVLFSGKFTQLTKILHDRRSRRSRQIPSLLCGRLFSRSFPTQAPKQERERRLFPTLLKIIFHMFFPTPPPPYGQFFVSICWCSFDLILWFYVFWSYFTPEKSFLSNYKNSQLLLTATAALSQNGQIAQLDNLCCCSLGRCIVCWLLISIPR